jgi:TPR repeat protein
MLLALALLMASTLAPWTGEFVPATAAEPDCPPAPDKVPCLAERGDPRAMYMMGRRAFADGRESGDLTEALQWALEAAEKGYRSGNMLLKMIYLQLGEGTHRDFVQAYVWLSEAIDDGDDYLLPWRKRLVGKMTLEQLAQAKRLAAD